MELLHLHHVYTPALPLDKARLAALRPAVVLQHVARPPGRLPVVPRERDRLIYLVVYILAFLHSQSECTLAAARGSDLFSASGL